MDRMPIAALECIDSFLSQREVVAWTRSNVLNWLLTELRRLGVNLELARPALPRRDVDL